MEETSLNHQKSSLRIALLVAIVAALCMTLYAVLANAADDTSVLTASTLQVDKQVAESAELLTYNVTLNNPSDEAQEVTVIARMPRELMLVPNGTIAQETEIATSANEVLWTGTLAAGESTIVSYQAAILGTRAQVGSTIAHEAYIVVGDVGSIVQVETEVVAESATAGRDVNRDFEDSTKSVDEATVEFEDELTYTIVISNSSDSVFQATMQDAIPDELTYVVGSLSATGGMTPTFGYDKSSQTITWTGTLSATELATVEFKAEVTDTNIISGEIVTNEATILAGSGVVKVSADVTLNRPPLGPTTDSLFPIVFKELEAPSILSSTRPNSTNRRTISWTNEGATVSYELQFDDNPAFSSPSAIIKVSTNEYTHAPTPTHISTTYYRVRAVSQVGQRSDWSNVSSVVGAYFDDFNDDTTGWGLRRTTYLEEVFAYYETHQSWFVIQVHDKWDWGLASPLQPAPQPPYALEMRMQPVNNGNLISFGIVTRGAWDGQPCFDYSSLAGIYERLNCFPEFFNANLINVGGYGEDLKLLWEKVDFLVWCGTACGNSPMKRLSHNVETWVEVTSVPNIKQGQNQWNDWRVEVYADRQVISVNGQTFATYNNSDHNDNPYFGIFASTDEYNNSTWRIDNVRVTPID